MKLVLNFLKDDLGATAVEYGLITGLIAISLIAGAALYGSNLNNTFHMLANKVEVK
jgi:pilus assembly protein Flp/PilA